MAEAKQWNVTITAPNGSTGNFVADATANNNAVVEQFRTFISTASKMDDEMEPLAGVAGIQPMTQARRSAS